LEINAAGGKNSTASDGEGASSSDSEAEEVAELP